MNQPQEHLPVDFMCCEVGAGRIQSLLAVLRTAKQENKKKNSETSSRVFSVCSTSCNWVKLFSWPASAEPKLWKIVLTVCSAEDVLGSSNSGALKDMGSFHQQHLPGAHGTEERRKIRVKKLR